MADTALGVDPKTLRKHYRDEFDTGHVKANSRIAESLYRKAMGDGPQSVTACIFWLKTRAQWKETSVQEFAGPAPALTITWQHAEPPRDPDRMIDVTRKGGR